MSKDFNEILLKAASQVKDLPEDAIYAIPEVELVAAYYGFSLSKDTKSLANKDSDTEAYIEAKARDIEDKEDDSFVFSALHVFASVLKSGASFSINSMLSSASKSILSVGLIAIKSLSLRLAISAATTYISTIFSLAVRTVKAIPVIFKHAFKLAMKNPYVAAALAAVGLTAAGVVTYKYFSTPKEEREANLKKAKEYLKYKNVVTGGRTEPIKGLFDEESHPEDYKDLAALANKQLTLDASLLDSALSDKSFAGQAYDQYTSVTGRYGTPEVEIIETMKKEGWDKMDTSSPRNYSKFGINANKYRSKEFIRNLTPEQAYQIYKEEYWDASGVANLPPHLRRMYFNIAVNMGVSTAKKLYARSDGTLEGLTRERLKYYEDLARSNPSQKKYLKGWRNRTMREYQESLNSIPAKDSYIASNSNPAIAQSMNDAFLDTGRIFAVNQMIFGY